MTCGPEAPRRGASWTVQSGERRLEQALSGRSCMNTFWRDRRVFLTGCNGLVGAWTVRALLDRGAHVVGLVRDRVTGSELVRAGLESRIDVVRGCVEDERLVERALAEYEVQTVFHLAAQTIVGIANKSP